jgi:hypothetical protein
MPPAAAALAGLEILQFLAVVGCSPERRTDKKQVAEERRSLAAIAELELDDGEMFSVAAIGITELERRLRGHVVVRDGLIILHGPFHDRSYTYVLPANTPWTISCGYGLAVYFGTAVSGIDGETDNVVRLDLFWGLIPRELCAAIAPALGKAVHSISAAR